MNQDCIQTIYTGEVRRRGVVIRKLYVYTCFYREQVLKSSRQETLIQKIQIYVKVFRRIVQNQVLENRVGGARKGGSNVYLYWEHLSI
jgi:hypothetical protein